MNKVRVSDQAKTDLVEIWEYIARDSSEAADRMLHRIVQTYLALADNPRSGRSRDELRSGLRSIPVGNYLIFYRLTDTGIGVARIVHGARNLEALFAQESEETYRFEEEDTADDLP